ncbi:MAG: hypothetical protein HYY93_14145 [Planctomycetes bacterium]|nr:hypothetical protein [Planctomycetota bacterium]
MFEDRVPRVRPVRRYRKPEYPSHRDPDPTLHPVPVPYPFAGRAAAAIASLGLTALLQTSCSKDPSTSAAPGTQPAAAPDSGSKPPSRNPFAVAESGLPFQTSPFGTGAPERLEEKLVRRIADRIFKEAGYTLRRYHPYDRDGVSFVADGYDPEKKVGYVHGTWETLDQDAIVHWDRAEGEKAPPAEDPKKLSLAEATRMESRAVKDREFIAVISAFDSRFEYQWYNVSEDLRKKVSEVDAIPDPSKRMVAQETLQEEIAREAVARLEEAVREYIAWAKSQGAQ